MNTRTLGVAFNTGLLLLQITVYHDHLAPALGTFFEIYRSKIVYVGTVNIRTHLVLDF